MAIKREEKLAKELELVKLQLFAEKKIINLSQPN